MKWASHRHQETSPPANASATPHPIAYFTTLLSRFPQRGRIPTLVILALGIMATAVHYLPTSQETEGIPAISCYIRKALDQSHFGQLLIDTGSEIFQTDSRSHVNLPISLAGSRVTIIDPVTGIILGTVYIRYEKPLIILL